ncbi:IS1595 family transposase [Chloroflexota bacterium]
MTQVNRNKPVRAKSSESQYSLIEFMKDYPDDATCLEWLWRNRYSNDGVNAYCHKCDRERPFKRYDTSQQRQSWTCTACGNHIHPTGGTIFHKSSTSLHLWFYAMYLMTSTRCGISAKQLERELGVTYKTAWRMAKEIRQTLMVQTDEPLGKTEGVELDETYIGGKAKNMHRAKRERLGGRGTAGKIAVFGAVERQGRVVAVTVPNVDRVTLLPHIRKHVMPASTVYTDEMGAYDPLKWNGYRHQIINHSEHVYVSGDIHTNTIEGFWSLVKRGIGGVYHAVSSKHLQGYLNEYAWRYNHRNGGRIMFETLLLRVLGR